jgi:hypothetical protein
VELEKLEDTIEKINGKLDTIIEMLHRNTFCLSTPVTPLMDFKMDMPLLYPYITCTNGTNQNGEKT